MNVKLFPTRSERTPVKILTDLDALASESIGFKFQGKSWIIKPMKTEAFMKIAKALQQVQDFIAERSAGKEVSDDDIYGGYLNFIQPACPEITLRSIKEMTLPQLNALVHLIVKHMTGSTNQEMRSDEVDSLGEKKKIVRA